MSRYAVRAYLQATELLKIFRYSKQGWGGMSRRAVRTYLQATEFFEKFTYGKQGEGEGGGGIDATQWIPTVSR